MSAGLCTKIDTFDVDLATFHPVVNWRFLAFAAGITALYSAGAMMRSGSGRLAFQTGGEEGRAAFLALRLGQPGHPMDILCGNSRRGGQRLLQPACRRWRKRGEPRPEPAMGLYAAALIVLGVVRRWRWVRLAGLALLAVPVVKLFAYDSRTLEQEYRVIAFNALSLILVAGGLLYRRYSHAVRGFLFQ